MGHLAAKPVRLQQMLLADLMSLLCLVSLGFVDRRAIAQEVAGQDARRTAPDPTVLTFEQEKAQAARPSSDFKECANGCPVMIVIPAGKFIMGSPENEPDRNASEGPRHEVTITKPFAVSKFEVTFEEWDACVAAAACPRGSFDAEGLLSRELFRPTIVRRLTGNLSGWGHAHGCARVSPEGTGFICHGPAADLS